MLSPISLVVSLQDASVFVITVIPSLRALPDGSIPWISSWSYRSDNRVSRHCVPHRLSSSLESPPSRSLLSRSLRVSSLPSLPSCRLSRPLCAPYALSMRCCYLICLIAPPVLPDAVLCCRALHRLRVLYAHAACPCPSAVAVCCCAPFLDMPVASE